MDNNNDDKNSQLEENNEVQISSKEELAEEVEMATNTDSENKVERIMSLENMINGYMMDFEKLKKDLKEQSAMLKDSYENDPEYMSAVDKAKEINKMKAEIKEKLLQDPSVAALDAKVSDLKSEVKDVRQALSDYLQQYYRESGLTEITGSDGEVHELIATVRLVKKRD